MICWRSRGGSCDSSSLPIAVQCAGTRLPASRRSPSGHFASTRSRYSTSDPTRMPKLQVSPTCSDTDRRIAWRRVRGAAAPSVSSDSLIRRGPSMKPRFIGSRSMKPISASSVVMRCAVGFVRPDVTDDLGHRHRLASGGDDFQDRERLAHGAELGQVRAPHATAFAARCRYVPAARGAAWRRKGYVCSCDTRAGGDTSMRREPAASAIGSSSRLRRRRSY